jgi:hypothetical protein
MPLAYVTERVADNYPAETPGMSAARHLVSIPPPPNELSALGKKILVAFAVDSVLYFVVICGLLVAFGKISQRPHS